MSILTYHAGVDKEEIARQAEQIVDAIAERSRQDPGMTLDQVQQLLVLRVREAAERLGIRPRALMGAVWRGWEQASRPPILGPGETRRVIARLAARGLLVVQERADAEPAVLWCGLTGDALDRRLAALDPPLDHEERLFVESIRRHLEARAAGVWHSWEVDRA